MNHYEDKRIFKSRQKIISSLLDLLEEKSFDDISIASICQHAQFSRTTFYAHFSDKNAIIQSFQTDLAREIFEALQEPSADIYHFLEQVVHVWDQHDPMLKLLFSKNDHLAIDQKTQEALEQRFKHRILPLLSSEQESPENLDYLATFYAGASLAVLKKWLTDEVKLSPEQLLEKFLLFLPKEPRQKTKLEIPTSYKKR